MHDDKGPGCQLEGQQEGESMRILPDPPVSGLNHARLCFLYPILAATATHLRPSCDQCHRIR